MMKINLTKLKNSLQSLVFFWQATIIIFFAGVIIILIVSAIWGLGLNQGYDFSSPNNNDGQKNETIDAKMINRVLEQIKIRSVESINVPTANPDLVDPNR